VGFGRREMQIAPAELRAAVRYQVAALQGCARAAGAQLGHVKAHGALYGMLARDAALARAFLDGVMPLDESLAIVGPPHGELREAARVGGFRYCVEGFADRGYCAYGSLVPRSQAGALLHGEAAARQGLALARGEAIRAVDGSALNLAIDTLCVHGDGAEAVALARALREAFGAGLRIAHEYGMTELSSQAYDRPRPDGAPGLYQSPPWLRLDVVDPVTLAPLGVGALGLVRVLDLANLGSTVAVQTSDLGRMHPEGLELLGRAPGATPRGCARAMDALLDP